MREYFARVARKAKGAQTTDMVAPNLPPVFPPQLAGSETADSKPSNTSLDVFGETGIRYSLHQPGSQNHGAKDQFVQNAESTAVPQPGIAQFSASEIPEPLPVIQPPPHAKLRQRAPESFDGSEAILPQVEASRVTPRMEHPAVTDDTRLTTQAAIVRRSDSESVEGRAAISLPESTEVLGSGDRRQLNGQSQNSKSSLAARQSVDSKPEETPVYVRIGKIEIRTAPPVQVLGSPQAQKKVPRGFAEYESVRRYATRHRFSTRA